MNQNFEEIYEQICEKEKQEFQKAFDMIHDDLPMLLLIRKPFEKLPDLSRFTNLDQIVFGGCGITEIHPSIGKMDKLEMLSLPENKLTSLPKEIGQLRNLIFLNLVGNPLTEFPEEIKYLDKSNGGSLFRIAVAENEIGEENYKKLKELLPTVQFSQPL